MKKALILGIFNNYHIFRHSGHENVIKLLIDHGVDLNCRDATLRTPLHWSCESGHANVVTILVKKGANMTLKDNFGWAPIHRAVFSGEIQNYQFHQILFW